MSDQPKPTTGGWRTEQLRDQLAEHIKAANEVTDENIDLEQQLAALVDALTKCEKVLDCPALYHARASKEHIEAWKAARIALAKVKERK